LTGRFRSNAPKRTYDTKTGKTYDSRNKAGQAVASAEFPDMDPADPSVWYRVLRRCSLGRFVDMATGRAIDSHGSLMQP
jgi:hypothetical protein